MSSSLAVVPGLTASTRTTRNPALLGTACHSPTLSWVSVSAKSLP